MPHNISELMESIPISALNENPNIYTLANLTKDLNSQLYTCHTSTQPETQPNPQTLLTQLVNTLDSSDENIRTLINDLPNTWQATNHKGTLLNKTILKRSAWGELREADDLHLLQQAILSTHPPPTHAVTQYTTYIMTSMRIGSSIWEKRHIKLL